MLNSVFISDFKRHATFQEDCRTKWHEAQEEVRYLKAQLNDVNQLNSKLESQYHHTTLLLKNEVKVRAHLQEEKKNLVSNKGCLFASHNLRITMLVINRRKSLNLLKIGKA